MGDDISEGERLAVTAAAVRDTGARALHIAENLRSAITSAGSDVDSVLGTWKGEAAGAYAAGWTELTDGARRIIDALHDLAEVYGWVADDYERQEADSSQAFGALRLD